MEWDLKRIILFLALFVLPGIALGGYLKFLDDPRNGISDNVFYEFVRHDGAIWASTGRGVTFSTDGGITWGYYDTTNGLRFNEITAIHSSGETLWVAVNEARLEPASQQIVLDGQGLNFTDDNGQTWLVVEPEGTVDFRRNVYDITGADSVITFSAWAGGLGVSFDNGVNWKKVYFTREDSIDYQAVLDGAALGSLPPTNLYFAAAVDNNYLDTMILWAGSAQGLMRYVFTPEYSRLSSMHIRYMATGGGFAFLCGDSGLTRFRFENGREDFYSANELNGLTGQYATAAAFFGDYLVVGTLNEVGGNTPGLARSADTGFTFTAVTTGLGDLDTGAEYPKDFSAVGDYLYMAAFEAGLYRSADSGNSWTGLPLDADPASLQNIVNSVDSYMDSLWIGTDSGIILAVIDTLTTGDITSQTLFPFVDSDTSGARCERIRIQKYYNADITAVDSTAVWAIQHPLDEDIGSYAVVYSGNAGTTWATNVNYLLGPVHHDIDFLGNFVMVVGNGIIRWTNNRGGDWNTITGLSIQDSLLDIPVNYDGTAINDLVFIGDTLYLGSDSGFAISPPGGGVFTWHLVIPDDDLTNHTWVDRYTVDSGLTGNFVNAMEIQYAPGGESYVWASTHPGASGGGTDGISMSPTDGRDWQEVYDGSQIWNFAFNGDTVFAAANAGLLMSPDFGATWDTINIAGLLVNYPGSVPYAIDSDLQVISVLVDNDTLWVGTEAGAGSIDLNEADFDDWAMYRAYDSTAEIYAFPTPFSPLSESEALYFHYPVRQDAYVTIEIYDFAMGLVKTVINNEFRAGGDDVAWMTDRWNGYNGKGDLVAAGIYHFKVSLSTGEVYWGKLAVEP